MQPSLRTRGHGPRPWLQKAVDEKTLVVFLLPARTDTAWFHRLVWPHASGIEFVEGRLWFEGENGIVAPAPFPSMVVIYDP